MVIDAISIYQKHFNIKSRKNPFISYPPITDISDWFSQKYWKNTVILKNTVNFSKKYCKKYCQFEPSVSNRNAAQCVILSCTSKDHFFYLLWPLYHCRRGGCAIPLSEHGFIIFSRPSGSAWHLVDLVCLSVWDALFGPFPLD